jgi:uncharacterized membrane protein YoaK (UPF0700 family)
LSKPREDEYGRERMWIALVLASVAGFIDAVGYIMLNGLFTAHMSGNTARLGVLLGHGEALAWPFPAALPLAAAISLFVFGIATGTVINELAARRGVRSIAAMVLGLQAVLLTIFMLYGAAAVGHTPSVHSARGFYVLSALAIVSIGLQACALRQVAGRSVRTTYISGVLTNLAQELVNYLFWLRDGEDRTVGSYLGDVLGLGSRRESGQRALLLGGISVSYLFGAVLGAWAEERLGPWALALPILALAITAIADLRRPVHTL